MPRSAAPLVPLVTQFPGSQRPGEIIPLGKIHPAAARKLVAQDLAAWHDGKCLVILRPYMITMLSDNDAWYGPKDRQEVSTAEMDRRKAWFIHALQGVVAAKAATGRSEYNWIPVPLQDYIDQLQAVLAAQPLAPPTPELPSDLDPADAAWFATDPIDQAAPDLSPTLWDDPQGSSLWPEEDEGLTTEEFQREAPSLYFHNDPGIRPPEETYPQGELWDSFRYPATYDGPIRQDLIGADPLTIRKAQTEIILQLVQEDAKGVIGVLQPGEPRGSTTSTACSPLRRQV